MSISRKNTMKKSIVLFATLFFLFFSCKKTVDPKPRPPAFLFSSYIDPYNGSYVSADSIYYLTTGFIHQNDLETTVAIINEIFVNPATRDVYSQEGRVYYSPRAHRRIMATTESFNDSANEKVKSDGYAILLYLVTKDQWELTEK
jgi:hypothetical protein